MSLMSKIPNLSQIAISIAIIWFSTSTVAQDVDVGIKGTCPDIDQISQAEKGRAFPRVESLEAIAQRQYISFAPEVQLKQGSNLFDPIDAPDLGFRDSVTISDRVYRGH